MTFVGREAELGTIRDWIASDLTTSRRAGILTGQPGSGKSALLEQLERECLARPSSEARWFVQLIPLTGEQSPGKSLEDALSLMLSRFRGVVSSGPRDRAQFKAWLEVLPSVGRLLATLVRDDPRPAWQRFIAFADSFNSALEAKDRAGRLVFLIDPQHELKSDSPGDWIPLAERLPAGVRLIIAQRPDDVLCTDGDAQRAFASLLEDRLGDLPFEAIEEWYDAEFAAGHIQGGAADVRRVVVRAAFARYGGYPLAHRALINVLAFEKPPPQELDRTIEKMPNEVQGLLDLLYTKLRDIGDLPHRLALLQRIFVLPTPRDIWEKAAGIDSAGFASLLENPPFRTLFQEVQTVFGTAFAPFHALFAHRLEVALHADYPRMGSLARQAWNAIAPALEEEEMSSRSNPFYELAVAVVVAARTGDAPMLYETEGRVFALKLRFGLLDDAATDQAILLHIFHQVPEIVGRCFANLGLLSSHRGNLDDAEQWFLRAGNIFEELHDEVSLSKTLGNLGVVKKNQGKHDEAVELYTRALRIDDKLDRYQGMAANYLNLGVVADLKGQPDHAEELYEKALALQEKHVHHQESIGSIFVNMGIIWRDRGDVVRAEELFRRGLDIALAIGDVMGAGRAYQQFGNLFDNKEQWADAEANYQKARECYQRLGRLADEASVTSTLGRILANQGRYPEAEEAVRGAIAIYEMLEKPSDVVQTYRNLMWVLSSSGNFAGARRAYDELVDLIQGESERTEYSAVRADAAAKIIQYSCEHGSKEDAEYALEMWAQAVDDAKRLDNARLAEAISAAAVNLMRALDECADEGGARVIDTIYRDILDVCKGHCSAKTTEHLVMAAVNAINGIGRRQQAGWRDRVEKIYQDIAGLSSRADSPVFVEERWAMAATNLMAHLGSTTELEALKRAHELYDELGTIAKSSGSTFAICNSWAIGAYNLVTDYAKAGQFAHASAVYQDLVGMSNAANAPAEVRLHRAMGACNLIGDLGQSGEARYVAEAEQVYQGLLEFMKGESEAVILLRRAMGARNLALGYEKLGEIERALELLNESKRELVALSATNLLPKADQLLLRVEGKIAARDESRRGAGG